MRLLSIPKKPLLESSLALACELLLAGGEMVWYNITAYNEIINFTVSKREVYNSKLRAGIKAERGMVMKGKNLERAVILGLLLSTGVYGTAWAYITPTMDADGKLVIEADQTVGTEFEVDGEKYDLKNYENVEIHFKAKGNQNRPLGVYSARYDLEKTNITVYVEGTETSDNNDSLHLTNHFPHFYVNNYSVYVNAASSDALNLSRDITTDTDVIIYGDLTAEVMDGNGIRANASINTVKEDSNKSFTASIAVKGNTNITINKDAGGSVLLPTAVWAGSEENWLLGQKSKGKGEIFLNGDTTIILNGKSNYGIMTGKNGYIEVNNLNINAQEDNSKGISANELNLTYILGTSENKYGSTIVMNGDSNIITMNGKDSDAINAGGKDINGNSNTVKSGEKGIGNLEAKGDIHADNDGKIDLTIRDGISLEGDIIANNGGKIYLNIVDSNTNNILNIFQGDIISDGNNSIADYKAKSWGSYNGDALAANGGITNFTFGNNSNWTGRADDYQDASNPNWAKEHAGNIDDSKFEWGVNSSGTVKIDMGKESTWNVTGQSWATELKGDNSYIILGSDENGNGYALHVNSVKGSNTFAMNVRPDETGNMLYVQNGINTQQNLVILNDAEVLENMDEGDAIRFATIKNSGGGFDGDGNISDDSVLPGNNVQTFGSNTRISDAGMFNVDFDIVYKGYNEKMDGDLAAENENSTVDEINDVYNGGEFSETKPGSEYVDEVYGGKTNGTATNSIAEAAEGDNPLNAYIVRKSVTKENLSDAGKTIINMSRANYKNAIYMDRLNKRMGEMRYVNGEEEQGLWVRLRHDRIGQSGDFRSMNTMYEVGYDVKQPTDNGEHRIGMAIDYMRGSTTYDDIMGKGETKRYGLWLYDTWLGEKGHYVDYVAKWGHLSNDFDITAKTTGEEITGDYSNNVFSVSAEYGKKNDMGNNWYFEPQAQLQLARVTGADYVTTQGSKVNVDGINSLIGRAGFRIGRDMNENSTVYLKADLLHEFMGDQTVTAADATGTLREEFENKGTWYDVGFGFAAKMSKNSYAFMDFEKSFGNDNDETYQINAGMQWTF